MVDKSQPVGFNIGRLGVIDKIVPAIILLHDKQKIRCLCPSDIVGVEFDIELLIAAI